MSLLSWIWPKKDDKSSKDVVAVSTSTVKRALCVGINDYPGVQNDLNGCLNDASDWSALLRRTFSFNEVNMVVNGNATVANVKNLLTKMVTSAKPGDILVFTYSGHGSSIPDQSGDEPDKRDEVLCCYDGFVSDDELRSIISRMTKGARLTVISDSCHSGTITREFLMSSKAQRQPGRQPPKPRYMPPSDGMFIRSVKDVPLTRPLLSQDNMVETLLTGCQSTEYSYDAYLNKRYNGAMTAHAIEIIKANPSQTWSQMYAKLRAKLPSSKFPQTPMLEASQNNKDKPLFT